MSYFDSNPLTIDFMGLQAVYTVRASLLLVEKTIWFNGTKIYPFFVGVLNAD